MPQKAESNEWILYKHTCDYALIKAVALDVKNACRTDISDTERINMQERLEALNLYKARNPKKKLDSIDHRINTLEYWMFGYEDGKRFMFSPLGNLFLKHINDEEKLCKIFIAMLFALQFEHQASSTDKKFQLYPFRLILKLLTDKRLDGKLYDKEVLHLLYTIESISNEQYEKLVFDLLKLRGLPDKEMAKLLEEDEYVVAKTIHEWEYTAKLLASVGVFKTNRPTRTKKSRIYSICHPPKSDKTKAITYRHITSDGFVSVSKEQIEYIRKLLSAYDFTAKPISLEDPERLRIDAIKEVYSFYPKLLLDEICESENILDLLELPKLIEEYSNNPDNTTAYLFEEVLEEGFNMFKDIDAKRIGGAGNTDIECLYITRKKKFAIDAKSTANKLSEINVSRLKAHREKIGGEYTIVITSRYLPAARRDINGNPIVIILASTFTEYLYNHILHDVRDVSYSDFDDIIIEHLGTDVSKLISDMTLNKFATNDL